MSNTPNIRFKGFIAPWEQRKLSDEFSDFIVPMRDKPKEFGGNIPWTRIEDIEGKYLNGTLSAQYVTEETVKEMNLKIIPKDSLIVSSSATFGVVAIVTQDLITNQTFIGLIPNNKNTLDYWYAFFYSDSARKYMRLQSAGSTIFYIARESFENMPIKIPSVEEMIRIGAYFDNLDNLITLHQHKCDELLEIKKYMLKKMFPKNGERFPEIRFKGFTAPWEQRKLSDIGEIITGSTPSTKHPEYYSEGGIPWVTPTDITENLIYETLKKLSPLGAQVGRVVPSGTILVTCIASIGKNAMLVNTGSFNQQINGLVPNNQKYDSYFLLTESYHWSVKMKREAATGTMQIVNKNEFSDIETYVPELPEQQAISKHFRILDDLITLHQRKCDELKDFKKYMLQNMFPQKG